MQNLLYFLRMIEGDPALQGKIYLSEEATHPFPGTLERDLRFLPAGNPSPSYSRRCDLAGTAKKKENNIF